jgi:hypothetical protein
MSDRFALTLLCLTAAARLVWGDEMLAQILGACFLMRLTVPNRFVVRDSAIAGT